MKKRRTTSRLFVALLTTLAVVAAACGGSSNGTDDQDDAGSKVERGGTLRAEVADFGFTGAFDPTGEYLGLAWSYYSNLLLRTLVTYKHISGPEGNEIVPDLATEVPEPTDGGLKYTFTLKDGVEFGPPLDREITSQDILYAFERIGTESLAAQYAFYYTVIEGMAEFSSGDAKTISGIETPDDKTIVFTLTQPTGDFLNRVAMPATAPIPEEVASCFTNAGDYGRYVISSGPYMLDGSDELDISSCKSMKPISGFDPNQHLHFARNPNYAADTDSPEVRDNFVDRVEIEINTNIQDQYDKIAAGDIDLSLDAPPVQVLREYSTNQELEDLLYVNDADRTWYITMNLTQPPFDDIHVRKAVNLVMDKDGLRRAWGGPIQGEIATHIVPPAITGGTPTAEEFDPFPSEGFTGDEEAAKAEMAQSKYDSDGDGLCDADECKGLLHITRNITPWTDMVPVIESSLAKIGIEVQTRELDSGTAYTTIQTTARNIPFASNAGWGKDYADASTFMVLFDSRSIIPQGNVNYSLVGLAPEDAGDLEVSGVLDGIPNVDDLIDECQALLGQERVDCWIELDKTVTEEIVPWVPYLWATNPDVTSEAVTQYEYDQFAGEPAWSHIAVDPSNQ
jgi:peptide/nickel transport system substrate-binding protein